MILNYLCGMPLKVVLITPSLNLFLNGLLSILSFFTNNSRVSETYGQLGLADLVFLYTDTLWILVEICCFYTATLWILMICYACFCYRTYVSKVSWHYIMLIYEMNRVLLNLFPLVKLNLAYVIPWSNLLWVLALWIQSCKY